MNINLTGRKRTAYINSQIRNTNSPIEKWKTISWMSKRPSMKKWTLGQLLERYDDVNAKYHIVTERL